MNLQLQYELDCTVRQFWALYFDPDFTTRLHREALGSTWAEIVRQDGDLTDGLQRVLRYAQRPDAPGPVRRLFGDEIVTTEESTFDPATSTSTFALTPGTMADKTEIHGSIHVEQVGGTCHERFALEARVRVFGVGPVVERFIERQARQIQDKVVAFTKVELAGASGSEP